MKVLVTGGAGFIGSHLTARLLDEQNHVVVLDDLSTGSLGNIARFMGRPRFRYQNGSITDAALVDRLVESCDCVVHLAAAVGVRLIIERPVHTIATNVHGTEIILEATARRNKLILLASTSEVYGKSPRAPFREGDDLMLGPTSHARWAYACSKALDEWLAFAYVRERGSQAIVVRFFNTVGPRQSSRYGMVLPTFAAQAVRGEPITVFGTGEQSRCFGHVDDAVEAVVRLLRTPAALGSVFNVGNDEEVTINQLAALVIAAAESSSRIVHVPYEEAYPVGFEDMHRRVPDLSRLASTIGFRPRTPLSKIIADVVADQRAHFQMARPVTPPSVRRVAEPRSAYAVGDGVFRPEDTKPRVFE
jgi:UDP-glucose 4-epimerase